MITGIGKAEAAMMLLRSMSPNIIAMDEITAYSDMQAVQEIIGCGVGLLTTMHGYDLSAIRKPAFLPLYDLRAFEKAILINTGHGRREYEVFDLYE